MAQTENFRTALNGFNRQDVVQYVEYLNNKHAAAVAQLEAQLAAAQAAQAKAEAKAAQAPQPDQNLLRQLAQEREKNAALEKTVAELRAQNANANAGAASTVSAASAENTAEELAAYRRAERAERQAQERAKQIIQKANGVLADATARVDETTAQLTALADQANEQLKRYQDAVAAAKATFQEIRDGLYAVGAEE